MTKRQAIKKFTTMTRKQLLVQFDIISSSIDYSPHTKDLLLEAIMSILNREKIIELAKIEYCDSHDFDLIKQ